jgi:translation initiation factor 3 subunit G
VSPLLLCHSYLEQITRRIKRTLQKSLVEHAVAERKTWAKFGLEKGKKPGPDGATTTVGETVFLKLTPGNKVRRNNMISPVFLTYAQAVRRFGAIGAASLEIDPFKGRCWKGRL